MARKRKKTKQAKKTRSEVPSTRVLIRETVSMVRANYRVLGGITLVFIIAYALFVYGSQNIELPELKSQLGEVFDDPGDQWVRTSILVGAVLGSGTISSGASGTLGFFLLLFVSLAYLWALRNIWAKKPVNVRESFYRGMYPLVPVLLVLLVIAIQLIPLTIANFVLVTVTSNGLATNLLEQSLLVVFVLSLTLLSAYLVTSSIFALIIATLPNMTPMKALRSARELVQDRRWLLFRRLFILALVLFVLVVGLTGLMVTFLPAAAVAIVTLVSIIILPLSLTYVYVLYRKII